MLRQTRAHHVVLSQMVDGKAQMLVMVSAIVIPLTMRYLSDELLRIPAAVMIFSLVITICFATYAVMPGRITAARRGVTDQRLFNPLFFGDFQHMTYDEYLETMEDVMSDTSKTYEVMLREVYGMGRYLSDYKYRYVRYGYRTFLIGMVTSFLSGVLLWFLRSPAGSAVLANMGQ